MLRRAAARVADARCVSRFPCHHQTWAEKAAAFRANEAAIRHVLLYLFNNNLSRGWLMWVRLYNERTAAQAIRHKGESYGVYKQLRGGFDGWERSRGGLQFNQL